MVVPFRSSMMTGMLRMPKRVANPGFSWVFICTTAALPATLSATVRTAGAKEMQCGHHRAQNSASTGPG